MDKYSKTGKDKLIGEEISFSPPVDCHHSIEEGERIFYIDNEMYTAEIMNIDDTGTFTLRNEDCEICELLKYSYAELRNISDIDFVIKEVTNSDCKKI